MKCSLGLFSFAQKTINTDRLIEREIKKKSTRFLHFPVLGGRVSDRTRPAACRHHDREASGEQRTRDPGAQGENVVA